MGMGALEKTVIVSSLFLFMTATTLSAQRHITMAMGLDQAKAMKEKQKTEQVSEAKKEDSLDHHLFEGPSEEGYWSIKPFLTHEDVHMIGGNEEMFNLLNEDYKDIFLENAPSIRKGEKTGTPLGDMKLLMGQETNIYCSSIIDELAEQYGRSRSDIRTTLAIYALGITEGRPNMEILERGEKALVETGTKDFIDKHFNTLFSEKDKEYFFGKMKKGDLDWGDIDLFLSGNKFYQNQIRGTDPDFKERSGLIVSAAVYTNILLYNAQSEGDKLVDCSLLPNHNMKYSMHPFLSEEPNNL